MQLFSNECEVLRMHTEVRHKKAGMPGFGITRIVFVIASMYLCFGREEPACAQTFGPATSFTVFDSSLVNGTSAPNDHANEATSNYWLPAVEIIGLNLGIGAVNTYIRNQEWARISWKTMAENFKTGFVWDEDGFLINQLSHPYHGALFFNAARSNGHGFWASIPFALFGSLMWEYLMENEAPSYNDIVNTPITGSIVGEILWRMSDLIIDQSANGFERVAREFSSTLLNPLRGFNRMINGEMWTHGTSTVGQSTDVDLDLSVGALNVFFDNNFEKNMIFLMMRANLSYGDQFNVNANKKPFDFFSLSVELNAGPGEDIFSIFASGVLWDDPVRLFSSSRSMFGIYQDFDLINNRLFKLYATTVTGQLVYETALSPNVDLHSILGISAMFMGATNSEYSSEYDMDHKVGPGASGRIGFNFSVKNTLDLYTYYKRYWIHTLSGEASDQFVGLLNAGVSVQHSPALKFAFEAILYERYGRYTHFPNTTSYNTAFRLFTTYRL